jgi:hypothetical protein
LGLNILDYYGVNRGSPPPPLDPSSKMNKTVKNHRRESFLAEQLRGGIL